MGTRITLLSMREVAHLDRSHLLVKRLAADLGSPPAIDRYLRLYWQIEADPIDTELVRTPELQIRQASARGVFAGDCDDAATLAAALCLALDWPVALVALRRPGDSEYSHVFARVPLLELAPGLVWDIDPIVSADEPRPLIGEEMTVPL